MLIVSIMMVAALNMTGSAAQARRTHESRTRGHALAMHLMNEILANYYEEPLENPVFGPEPGESGGTRAAFNDVDDYHGWSASPPQLKDGTPMAEYAGWTRSVAVHHASPANPAANAASDQDLKRITVTVTSDTGRQVTLVALRARNGAYDHRPRVQTPVIGWIGVEARMQDGDRPVTTGVNLLNQPVTVPD